jgi:hypothetical protein
VALALQHSPEQVAPLPALQSAALEFIVQKLLAPPNTATKANGITAFSSILLIKRIILFSFS